MEQLIYDRKRSDVEYASNNPSSSSYLKGAYNYTDLNRVESWCEYLKNYLNEMGYSISFTTKTDWTMEDFPLDSELERIRLNIRQLMRGFAYISKIYTYSNSMDYTRANRGEKILWEIYNMMFGTQDLYVHCGVANSGQNRFWQNRFRRKYNHVLNILADGRFKNISANYQTNTTAKITKQSEDYIRYEMTSQGTSGYVYNIYARATFNLEANHTYMYIARWRNTIAYPSNSLGGYLRYSGGFIKQIRFNAHGNNWQTDYSTYTPNNSYTGVQLGISGTDINQGADLEIQYQAFIDITNLDSDYVERIKQNIDRMIAFPKVATVSLMSFSNNLVGGDEN